AIRYFRDDKPMWQRMMLRGMADDFSWGKPAEQYLALYNSFLPPPKKVGDPCPACAEPEKLPEAEKVPIEELPEEQASPEKRKE
ncbi:MAG: hypothetical protein ABFD03_03435, partial [Clostridiaceae bacterium]